MIRRRTTWLGLATAVAALAVAATTTGGASAQPRTPQVPGTQDGASVYTVDVRDGRTMLTVHDMADGASADRARSRYRAEGRRVLDGNDLSAARATDLAGSSAGLTAAATTCASYGTAHQWCGRAWSYGGYNDPQVYFLDHTPTGYPVSTAVNDWYQAVGIDAYYRWYTDDAVCSTTRHCVTVYTYHPDVDEYGSTSWPANSPGGPVYVYVSDRIRGTTQARKTTCHELGHALGLDHNTSTNSCLVQGQWTSGESYKPSSQDFRVLTMMYPKAGT